MRKSQFNRGSLPAGLLLAALLLGAGCKKQPAPVAEQPAPSSAQPGALSEPAPPAQPAPPSDAQLSKEIRAKIGSQPALEGQRIHVSVSRGVATLTGRTENEASRALAAAESGSVNGIRTVVNNLEVLPPKAAKRATTHPQAVARVSPPPPMTENAPLPPPPPPPVKTVTLPAGTVLPVRMTDSLDSASTEQGSIFHASLATPLIADGMIAAPRGARVVGRVITAKDATHFSGSSELTIELTKIFANGQEISLVTDSYTKQGAGRGKNTAVKSGAGAAFGAILGALAGGGKGAAIGAVTGGGVGAGVNGVTRGQQVQIPSESLVNFKLQSPINVSTSRVAGGAPPSGGDDGPQLQRPQ